MTEKVPEAIDLALRPPVTPPVHDRSDGETSGPIFRLPARLGRYTLLKRLGVGGMAEVFLAQQDGPAGFQRSCVVKRILPHLAEDRRFVEMFQREARIAALLANTNIVQIHELGEEQGVFFIAMEYVDGAPLHRLARAAWRQNRSVPLEVVCCAIADAGLGLQAAHELRDAEGHLLHLVHRDISPDNLMINREGVTKILDFGVAKTTQGERTASGELKGKIPFLSPEQIRGDPVDGRADLYALGVTFYWLLTGKRPFTAPSDLALMQRVLTDAPKPPNELNPTVPDAVNDVVLRLLEKDREHRLQSGAEVHDALMPALGSRRAVVAPFVNAIIAAGDMTADQDVPELADGFLPSTPHTDVVRAGWKRLGPVSAAVKKTETEVLPPPRSRRAVFVGAALSLVLVGAGAAAIVVLPGEPAQPAAPTAPARPPPTAPPVAPASAPGSPGDTPRPPATATAPATAAPVDVEPVLVPPTGDGTGPAKRALREVEVKGPAGIAWESDKGRVVLTGSGTLKLPASARRVIAYDARRGVRTSIALTGRPIEYAALPRGKLQPRANPYADVFIGAEALGTTPFPAKDVVAGTYVVRFVYQGREERRTVDVKDGETVRVAVDFMQ